MSGLITATVTGKVGAGSTITSAVFSNITAIDFDAVGARMILTGPLNRIFQIDISAATTITITLSAAAGNYTVTVS
jgi:molybdopterin-binding protein